MNPYIVLSRAMLFLFNEIKYAIERLSKLRHQVEHYLNKRTDKKRNEC